MDLVYRHCLWCNGIFKQHKQIQKFCSDRCREDFSINRSCHGGFPCGDPPNTIKKTYKTKPPKHIIDKYTRV